MDHTSDLKRAMGLQLEGRLEAAGEIYRDILKESPDSHDALHLLGLVEAESDDDESGIKLIEQAVRLRPDVAAFHHNLGGIYRRVGRLGEAESEFRQAIQLKANYGEAYQGLAEMVKFEQGDPLFPQIEKQLETADQPTASYLHFAAGKILDDQGAYALAFEHYKKGNEAANRKFSAANFRSQTKNILYQFSAEFLAAHQSVGDASRQPFFVVGMPRSGSSLVEQILASHSTVFGAGELSEVKLLAQQAMLMTDSRQAYPDCLPDLKRNQFKQLSAGYLNKTKRKGFDHVVDKHPLNFIYLGLILLMFPNAKIIHTVRDPLDTCLSCYFQNFTKGQDYSFNLNTLGEFYLDYKRLMSHWHLLFPGRILDVHYEQVLSDQEAETRRLLDFCELGFEPQCLDYHKTTRTVKTASFLQVRQPIYQSSKGRAVHYKRQLSSLAKIIGLQTATEPPVTISRMGKQL